MMTRKELRKALLPHFNGNISGIAIAVFPDAHIPYYWIDAINQDLDIVKTIVEQVLPDHDIMVRYGTALVVTER